MSATHLRLAYVAYWNGTTTGRGVTKKIVSQLEAWNRLAEVDARLFLLTPTPEIAPDTHPHVEMISLSRSGRRRAWNEMAFRVESWRPDAIYWRFTSYQRVMGSLGSRFPIIVEINSDDLSEEAKPFALRSLAHRLKRPWIFRSSAGLVFVSQEVSQRSHFSRYGLPNEVIGNSIRLEGMRLAPANSPEPIQVAFLGSPGQRWHGLDRVAELASRLPKWIFHVIGPPAGAIGEGPNLRYHGYLSSEAYRPILQSCHLALGSLALFRAGLNEISPLKVREYLALGLPVIHSGKDTDFPDGAPFLFELPNAEASLAAQVPLLRAFAKDWADKRVPVEAISHLDVGVKEARRIDFVRAVVASRSHDADAAPTSLTSS